MLRWLYAALLGAVGAGIVHITITLLIPSYSPRDAWSRLELLGDLNEFVPAGDVAGAAPMIRPPDPMFAVLACRFDLSGGSVHIRADGTVPYWSASVYDRSGQNIFSFNDHAQADRILDFAVMTPVQTIEARKDLPEELESSVLVEADIGQGIVVIRAFRPDPSWTGIVAAFLRSMTCKPV